MKRWLQRTLFGVFGAALLVGGLTACGHRHGGPWQASEAESAKMRERILERAGRELKLDDTQKQRLAVLADKLHEQRLALVGRDANPRDEALSMMAGPKFDRERAQAFVEAKTGALRSKSPEVISAAADFFDSLRPDQQQQLRDFLAKRRS
jgi:Spy/CpxP family protein refolding chaperone